MIPTVDGRTLHFVLTGVYDGLFVMRDVETNSLWNHILGEAVHGPLAGKKMPLSNLLQTTVKQQLSVDPSTQVAISSRPITGPGNRLNPDAQLSDKFVKTLDLRAEDTRRPRMELGLGVTAGGRHRFYPLDVIRSRGDGFVDALGGRRMKIFIDEESATPTALFVDAAGTPVAGERPLQVFTRWYGFSLTFPGCEVFES